MHERMLRGLGGTVLAMALGLGGALVLAEEATTPVRTGSVGRTVDKVDATPAGRQVVPSAPVVPPGMSDLRELPAGTKFQRIFVGGRGAGGAVAGGVEEKLIFSNTLGRVIIPIPSGFLAADDVATVSSDDCRLTRFSFQVTGNANLSVDENRPYSVTFALYDTCPAAVPSSQLEDPLRGRLIVGTKGTVDIPTPDPTEVIVDLTEISSQITSETSMWLGLTPGRDNVAIIGGTPALEGFSGDLISFPALGCSPNLGSFPMFPHGSFNIEIFGEANTCPARHLQYRNTREDGAPLNVGANGVIVDDLRRELASPCLLTGYEVGVEGQGFYEMELRAGCSSDPPSEAWFPDGTSAAIAGTYERFNVGSGVLGARVLRATVDPPVSLPPELFVAVKVNNSTAGPIITGVQAKIGLTDIAISKLDAEGVCIPAQLPNANAQGAIQVTLICADPAPLGACCDMIIKECEGGPDDGERCNLDSQCESPGLCNPPCREVPLVNCAFPQRGTLQLPAWVPGAVCDGEEDPFSDQISGAVCGESACCFEDTDGIEKCRNIFQRDCDVVGNQEQPRQWQRGRFCGQIRQSCPLIACLGREGDCKEEHLTPGCNDPVCCSAVCRTNFGLFCCEVFWDNACVDLAINNADCIAAPGNDNCAGANAVEGYSVEAVTIAADTEFGTQADTDPLPCCHNGMPNECISGGDLGDLCDDDIDCGSGTCGPGAPVGRHTVWYKFVAEDTSIKIDTCASAPPAVDSLLTVFRAGDPSSNENACQTLGLIGCNDDGCSSSDFSERNSSLCVQDLQIGETYYVMVSTKRINLDGEDPAGRYDVRFQSPCPDERPLSNDFCDFAEPVTDTDCEGCEPIMTDLTDATLQCPAPFVLPDLAKDQWFEYTATCTGTVSVDTCGSGFDTSLFVYEGCDICPDFEDQPLAFNDNSTVCGSGSVESGLTFEAVAGDCYRIRVGDQSGTGTMGQLRISCAPVCPSGQVTWIDPPRPTVDAGRPWLPTDLTRTQVGITKVNVRIVPDGVQAGGNPTNSECWDICESNPLDGSDIQILSITAQPDDTYQLTLNRPLTAFAVTTFEYLGNSATQDFVRVTTHPGNVNGDIVANSGDVFLVGDPNNLVVRLRLALDPDFNPPFPPLQGEPHSLDINRSGALGPLDLLDLMDLLNGAEEYVATNGSGKPESQICPNP